MDASKIALGVIITALALINMYLFHRMNVLKKDISELKDRQDKLQEGLLDSLDIIVKLKETLSGYFNFIHDAFEEAKEEYNKTAQSVENKQNELNEDDVVPWE